MMNEAAESFDESLADANSCLDALRLMKLDREIDELSSRIAEADRAGEDELRDQLAMKKLDYQNNAAVSAARKSGELNRTAR